MAMNMKQAIHTTIKANTKKRLLEYGKGVLNEGIEAVVEIADRQEVIILSFVSILLTSISI
jgi:hypothetical protein